MKLICIKSVGYNYITRGKLYDSIYYNMDLFITFNDTYKYYKIVNDVGIIRYYDMDLFITLNESRRLKLGKLNKLV
jgi:hypothetical protein